MQKWYKKATLISFFLWTRWKSIKKKERGCNHCWDARQIWFMFSNFQRKWHSAGIHTCLCERGHQASTRKQTQPYWQYKWHQVWSDFFGDVLSHQMLAQSCVCLSSGYHRNQYMQLYGLFRFRKTAAIVMCSRYSQSRQNKNFRGPHSSIQCRNTPTPVPCLEEKIHDLLFMHSRNTLICQLLRVALCEGGNACASCRMNSVWHENFFTIKLEIK